MNNMKLLYHSLIHSHLSYGTTCMLWSSASHLSADPVSLKLVKRNVLEDTSPLFKKLNILKLQDISRFQLVTFMYNFARSELPPPLITLFTQNTDIHGHNTRQSRNPHVEHRQKQKHILCLGHMRITGSPGSYGPVRLGTPYVRVIRGMPVRN